MTIKNTGLSGTDWTTGEALTYTDLNDTFNACQRLVAQVYTGTGYDSDTTGGTDTQDHEMDAITAPFLLGATYLKITLEGESRVQISGVDYSSVQIKIQTKEVAGSYADVLPYKWANRIQSDTANGVIESIVHTNIVYYHVLTAGEKSNGVQVKVFSSSYGDRATFDNMQTVIEVV